MASRSPSPSVPSSSSPIGSVPPGDSGPRGGDPVDDLLAGLRPRPLPGPRERLGDWWSARVAGPTSASPARASAALVGVVVVAAVGWWLLRPPAAPLESTIPRAGGTATAGSAVSGPGTASEAATGTGSDGSGAGPAPDQAASTATTGPVDLVVQAAGAVARPGVYRLPPDGRVDDLVRRAGGFTPDADGDRVNLAAPLADGERVWIPRRGEEEVPEVVAGSGGGGAAGSPTGPAAGGSSATGTSTGSGPPAVVDLNRADADQLDALPGVGPATAAAILAYRQEHGRFGSVDELLEVRGIGDAKLEQLRPLVRV